MQCYALTMPSPSLTDSQWRTRPAAGGANREWRQNLEVHALCTSMYLASCKSLAVMPCLSARWLQIRVSNPFASRSIVAQSTHKQRLTRRCVASSRVAISHDTARNASPRSLFSARFTCFLPSSALRSQDPGALCLRGCLAPSPVRHLSVFGAWRDVTRSFLSSSQSGTVHDEFYRGRTPFHSHAGAATERTVETSSSAPVTEHIPGIMAFASR